MFFAVFLPENGAKFKKSVKTDGKMRKKVKKRLNFTEKYLTSTTLFLK